MVHSVLTDGTFRHVGRKGVFRHTDFPEVSKSIFEGLGRFGDNHIILISIRLVKKHNETFIFLKNDCPLY